MIKHGRTTKEIRQERLATDPAFRERWDRTAVARAVANVLIQQRAERGWSQTRLAKELGISQPQVARLESGEHNPTWETLHLIFSVFGLSFNFQYLPSTANNVQSWPPEGAKAHEELTTSSGERVLVAVG